MAVDEQKRVRRKVHKRPTPPGANEVQNPLGGSAPWYSGIKTKDDPNSGPLAAAAMKQFKLKESYHPGSYALLKQQSKFNHFGIGSHAEIAGVIAAGTNLHFYELLGPERKPYGDLEWSRLTNDQTSFEAACRDMLPAQLERFRQALIVAGHHCGAIPGEDDALMTSFGPDEKHPGHWKFSVHVIIN